MGSTWVSFNVHINGEGVMKMATRMARFEFEALMAERAMAMKTPGMPLYPSMELVFQRLPRLVADLDQALAVIELLEQHPELVPYIPPGGLE
jgi:hypothetical protein